jgi:hypothetical protein
MADQPLVPQEIQDQIDGKLPLPQPPVTGNKRLIDEMKKQKTEVQNA